MDYTKEYLKDQVKNKFYGHDKLKSKVEPIYPTGVEREYIKLTNAYMNEYKKLLVKYVDQLNKAIQMDRKLQKALRVDSQTEVEKLIDELFKKLERDITNKQEGFGLRRRLEQLAYLTRKLSIREWKKVVKATLGINILDDYYMGEFYKQIMKSWVDENIGLISTLPQDSLGEMKEIVKRGFSEGTITTEIAKELQNKYNITKRHARLIARDQIGKLYSKISQKQQTDAGCTQYTWSTSQDSRVRDSHRHLNRTTQNWDSPPIVDERTGRRCHPGEDYQCRCVALPVFNLEGIRLPIQKDENSKPIRELKQEKVEKQQEKENKAKKKVNVLKGYYREELESMSLENLRKVAEKLAVAYYKSGKSGISFGNSTPEEAAKILAMTGSKTSLIRDILSMQRRLK